MNQYPIVSICLIIICGLIVVMGTLGNLLVIWIVSGSKTMWTATNILIANLALADVFVLTFDLPLSLHYQLINYWSYGKAMCHILPLIFAVTVYVSSLTLTAIAGDRYVLIVKPLATKLSPKKALLVAFVIFIFSVVVASPIAIYSKYDVLVDEELGIDSRFCTERWPTMEQRKAYTLITLIAQFLLPLLVIACLYLQIFKKIRHRMKNRSGHSSRTNRMLTSVVLVFALTWTPFQLVSSLFEFYHAFRTFPYVKLIDISLRLLAMSSSCINPILYGYMNKNFNNGFIRAFSVVLPKLMKPSLRQDAGERSIPVPPINSKIPHAEDLKEVELSHRIVSHQVQLAEPNQSEAL